MATIDPRAPLERLCLLGCGITIGSGAVRNTAQVESGSRATIFSLGEIGLAVIIGAVIARAERILAADPRYRQSTPPSSRSPGSSAPPIASTPETTPLPSRNGSLN